MRLFCLPYAGGAASVYREWQATLPKWLDVCPVELPGRGRRICEPAYRDARKLAADIAAALWPYFDAPFALFGHSMGALLAFEVVRRIRAGGGPDPTCLFVSGRGAPHAAEPRKPLSTLADNLFVEEVKRLDGTPPEVFQDAELAQLLLPILRADFEVCESYSYEESPILNCPIVAFGGVEDAAVTRGSLLAWREQTAKAFTLRMMPGGHFFLRTAKDRLLDEVTIRLSSMQ